MSEDAYARPWGLFVGDMIGFCERVLSYTQGMDLPTFLANPMAYDAVLRNIELIGEAASHIPVEVRATHSDIAWRDIIDARNRMAHGYLGIDDDIVWDIVQTDIPKLLSQLRRLLGDLQSHE